MTADASSQGAGSRGARLAAGVVVALTAAVALMFRTAFVEGRVVREDGVYLQGADAWHHLRQIEQLVRHFPSRMTFDPYARFPDGQDVAVAPLFDVLAACVALVAGMLSPSARTVEIVTAWLPAVLGAATCVPAYLIARRLAGRAAGMLAAICIAVLPGQLLSRTMLGFSDHHALEALLAPLTVVALLRALDREDRRAALRDATVAGAVLVLYLLSWTGGALLVLVLGAWAVLQINVDHLRGADAWRTGRVAATAFGVALAGQSLLGWGIAYSGYQRMALAGALVASLALSALAAYLRQGGRSRVHLPMATVAAALGAGALIARVSPDTLRSGWRALTWFASSGVQQTVGEAAPLLRPLGELSFGMAWAHFGTALPAAILALAVLARRIVREGRASDSLVAAWSVAMLLATLGQNRFGYYFAVCAAVLSGVLIGPALARLWVRTDGEVPVWIRRGLWPTAAIVGLVVPVAPVALVTSLRYNGPSDAWVAALRVLRERSPEPFGDAAAFERLVGREEARPASSGVLSWWDGGYWITTLAHRVPLANPTQAGAREAAELLLATSPHAAARACREQGLRHVVLDAETPMLPSPGDRVGGEIGQLARWTDIDPQELFRTYFRRLRDGSLEPVVLFAPAYFETLAVRLQVFGGRAVEPTGGSQIVRFREEPDGRGGTRRILTEAQAFDSFAQAARRLERAIAAGETDVRLVSDDPLRTCVPLDAADGFRLVFASDQVAYPNDRLQQMLGMGVVVPEVTVFEVVE